LKKPFNLASVGTYNYIKVKFNYYYLDRWQGDEGTDKSFAAIAKDVNGTGMVIGYMYEGKETEQYPEFGPNDSDGESNFGHVNDWTGANCCWSDFFDNAEMVFRKCDNCNDTFWLMFGAALTTTIKNYGVGMIEIWVK